jgi:hypothetical protein
MTSDRQELVVGAGMRHTRLLRESAGACGLLVMLTAALNVGYAQNRLTWQGVVVSDKDPENKSEIQVVLSSAYRPLYEYETSTGTREVELTTVGQMLRFVPPGGGVKTVRVEELQASPQRVRLALSIKFERSSGGVLEQSWAKTAQTLVKEGTGFRITIEYASGTRLSDRDTFVGPNTETEVYRGLLSPR